ncbi:MFS transporter [Rubrimonas sp.]|uniref:MFS transporter n=1 Tax=Rubrimonas sp. TaxID=2036015 RepID=UPI002FDCAD79
MMRSFVSVGPLLVSVALLIAGCGVLNMLLPLRAEHEGFGSMAIGLLGSAQSLGFIGGCLWGGRIIARVGHIRAFAALVGLVSCLFLAHAIVVDPAVWWARRALGGACFATIFMVIESWLNARADNRTRGAVFCAYAVTSHLAGSIGHVFVAAGEPDRFVLFSIGSILVSLAALPVALSRCEAPQPSPAARVRLLKLWRASPVGVVGCAIAGMSAGAFWSLGPSYVLGVIGDASLTPLLMTAPVLAAALVQWPIGFLSDRMDRRLVIAATAASAALVCVALALGSVADAGDLVVALAVLGAAFIPIGALSAANANDFAPADAVVETAAGLLLIASAGAVAGPVVASWAISAMGPGGLFATLGSSFGLLALFALVRSFVREAAPAAERGRFADAVVAFETVSAVEPASAPNADVSSTPAAAARISRLIPGAAIAAA